jgi:Spy/CpxP family protein refolding chaperone
MRPSYILALISVLALATLAQGQPHGGPHHSHAPQAGPYAGFEQRHIKAFSDQQLADLRVGRGMGLALPAELNGYPGPLHVLELADALALTHEQRTRAKSLVQAMRAEVVPLGEQIIAQEGALDDQFAERRITPDSLKTSTARIGGLQGELRAAHLRYHLIMRDLLTPEQVARYAERRGYRRSSP